MAVVVNSNASLPDLASVIALASINSPLTTFVRILFLKSVEPCFTIGMIPANKCAAIENVNPPSVHAAENPSNEIAVSIAFSPGPPYAEGIVNAVIPFDESIFQRSSKDWLLEKIAASNATVRKSCSFALKLKSIFKCRYKLFFDFKDTLKVLSYFNFNEFGINLQLLTF